MARKVVIKRSNLPSGGWKSWLKNRQTEELMEIHTTDWRGWEKMKIWGHEEYCGYLQNLELNIHQTFFFMILKIWHIHISYLKTVQQKMRIYNNNLAEHKPKRITCILRSSKIFLPRQRPAKGRLPIIFLAFQRDQLLLSDKWFSENINRSYKRANFP